MSKLDIIFSCKYTRISHTTNYFANFHFFYKKIWIQRLTFKKITDIFKVKFNVSLWVISNLFYKYLALKLVAINSQTVKRQSPNNEHLSTTTTIFSSCFSHLEYKGTSEQRLPVNNGHYFGSQVVVIHNFNDILFFEGLFTEIKFSIEIILNKMKYEISLLFQSLIYVTTMRLNLPCNTVVLSDV